MPRDFPWTLDVVIHNFIQLMDALGIGRFHLVGAKLGGTIARVFAACHPERVLTLTVVGTPPPVRANAEADINARTEECEKYGYEPRARQRMALRLGSAFPPEGIEWWTNLMDRTPASPKIGFIIAAECRHP